tara:strand:- start:127 stop:1056 length:930 start_codon:yes stop_codon:yes gene_type:complete
MKLLVTGGAGFIGSNLSEYLIKKGHEIIILDNLSTGKKENIKTFIREITFYDEDIKTFNFNFLKKIDAIIHLAAQASVPLSITNFQESSIDNIIGTLRVLNFCKENKIPLVYASSSAVYGTLDFGNDESTEVNLQSPYSVDKYSMELYSKTIFNHYNLSSIGLRFFNVYGPKQDPSNPYSGVISIFANRTIKNQNILINGGHQTRDFIYILDVIKVIYKSIYIVKSKKIYDVVNVLTGTSISINRVADMIMKETGNKVDKIFKKLELGDPEKSSGSVSKIKQYFSKEFNDFTDFEVGLSKTINYLKIKN